MTTIIAPISALLLSVALLLTGNGLLGTLLPVRAGLEGFGSLNIGILGSSYYVGFALGCFLGARLVKRVGHIRVFTAAVSIASVASIVHALVVTPEIWWIVRAVTGFCFATLYIVIESWLNEKSTNETRGLVFSIYTIINLSFITIGQMALTLSDPRAFTLFGLASIVISLAAVPVALTKASAPQPLATVSIRPRYLYKISPVGFLGCLAVGLANGPFWSLAPVYAQRVDGNVAWIAIFMSICVIAGAVGQYPLGRLSDHIDRRIVIILSCLGAAVAGLSLAVIDHNWQAGFLAAGAVYGLFAFPLYALAVAHLNDFVEEDGFVEAASGLLLVFAIGAVVGPLIASAIMRFFGVDMLFAYTACVHLCMAIYAFYRLRQRAAPLAEDRVQFVDSLRVAHTVSAIDPLSGDASPIKKPPVNDVMI